MSPGERKAARKGLEALEGLMRECYSQDPDAIDVFDIGTPAVILGARAIQASEDLEALLERCRVLMGGLAIRGDASGKSCVCPCCRYTEVSRPWGEVAHAGGCDLSALLRELEAPTTARPVVDPTDDPRNAIMRFTGEVDLSATYRICIGEAQFIPSELPAGVEAVAVTHDGVAMIKVRGEWVEHRPGEATS